MADSFTQVPPDSTGDKIDTEQLTVNAQTVERQRIQVTGTAAVDIAPVDATAGLKVDLGADNDVIQATASNLNAQVVGEIAHDSPDSGNPVKIGGRAFTTLPIAAATLDRVDLSMTDQGAALIGGVDGTTPREIAVNASGQLEVDIVAQQLSPIVVDLGANNDVGLNAGSNNIGDVDVLTLPASTNTLEVVGDVAENAPAAGNPVLVGGRFDSTPRTLANLDMGAIALAADGAVHIDDGGNAITVDGTVTANAGTGTFNVDLDSLAATAIDVNNGVVSAGTQRVTLASDGTGQIDVTDRATRDLGTVDISAALPDSSGASLIGSIARSATHMYDDLAGGQALAEVKFAVIDEAASGDNVLIAAVVGKKIRVLSYAMVAAAAVTAQFQDTGGANLSGGMQLAANGGVSANSDTGLFETTDGDGLDLNLSGAVSVDGHFSYIEVD